MPEPRKSLQAAPAENEFRFDGYSISNRHAIVQPAGRFYVTGIGSGNGLNRGRITTSLVA